MLSSPLHLSSISSLLASVAFVARGFLACQCCPLLCSLHRLYQTRSAGRGEMFPAPGAALWPRISSPLRLNWLGQCSELISAPLAAAWWKMHRVPRAEQVQLLGASDEFGCWCLGQLLALPLGWLEGAQGLMVSQGLGALKPHLVLNPGHRNLRTLTLCCLSRLCCSGPWSMFILCFSVSFVAQILKLKS